MPHIQFRTATRIALLLLLSSCGQNEKAEKPDDAEIIRLELAGKFGLKSSALKGFNEKFHAPNMLWLERVTDFEVIVKGFERETDEEDDVQSFQVPGTIREILFIGKLPKESSRKAYYNILPKKSSFNMSQSSDSLGNWNYWYLKENTTSGIFKATKREYIYDDKSEVYIEYLLKRSDQVISMEEYKAIGDSILASFSFIKDKN